MEGLDCFLSFKLTYGWCAGIDVVLDIELSGLLIPTWLIALRPALRPASVFMQQVTDPLALEAAEYNSAINRGDGILQGV